MDERDLPPAEPIEQDGLPEPTDNRPRPEDGRQDDLPQEPDSVYQPPVSEEGA